MKGNKLLVVLAVLAIVAVVVFMNFGKNDVPVESAESVAIHLTDENFHETVDNSDGVAFVDFWASWCSPCVQLAPILEEVATEYDVTLYKLNVDENPLTSAEFQISGIPMVYVYKDGKVVDSQMGLGTKQTYIDLVEKYSD